MKIRLTLIQTVSTNMNGKHFLKSTTEGFKYLQMLHVYDSIKFFLSSSVKNIFYKNQVQTLKYDCMWCKTWIVQSAVEFIR